MIKDYCERDGAIHCIAENLIMAGLLECEHIAEFMADLHREAPNIDLGFMLIAQIILKSGIASRIFESAGPLLSYLPGKLLVANVFMCALFAAILSHTTKKFE